MPCILRFYLTFAAVYYTPMLMKRTLLSFLLFTSFTVFGQSLSKTHIIYESKNQIIMNDGKQYELVTQTRFEENVDKYVPQQRNILGHVLRLNRILEIKNDTKSMKLAEWSNEAVKFYEYSKNIHFARKENQESDFNLQAN